MPNKGQIISFFVVLAVIIVGAWQAVSNGDDLKQVKEFAQPAFIVQQPQQEQQFPPEASQEIVEMVGAVEGVGDVEEKCQTEECLVEIPDAIPSDIEGASVLIDDGSGSPKEFVLEVQASTTAFDLLQEASLTAGFAIESEEYDFGVFVESINNKRNRQDNKYWLFYINEELSQLTPDKVVVNPEDKIEFIFTNR